mmetsp:Transcript_43419/g.68770  ORF Transcript_43419/g.68770 Transcript_43419/m.68770 type:complete len:180 (+) Transcript_43419:73-612(+)
MGQVAGGDLSRAEQYRQDRNFHRHYTQYQRSVPVPVAVPRLVPVGVPVPMDVSQVSYLQRVPAPRWPEWEFPYHDPAYGPFFRPHQADLDWRLRDLQSRQSDRHIIRDIFENPVPLDELYETIHRERLEAESSAINDSQYPELGHPLPTRKWRLDTRDAATVTVRHEPDPTATFARWIS